MVITRFFFVFSDLGFENLFEKRRFGTEFPDSAISAVNILFYFIIIF